MSKRAGVGSHPRFTFWLTFLKNPSIMPLFTGIKSFNFRIIIQHAQFLIGCKFCRSFETRMCVRTGWSGLKLCKVDFLILTVSLYYCITARRDRSDRESPQ